MALEAIRAAGAWDRSSELSTFVQDLIRRMAPMKLTSRGRGSGSCTAYNAVQGVVLRALLERAKGVAKYQAVHEDFYSQQARWTSSDAMAALSTSPFLALSAESLERVS